MNSSFNLKKAREDTPGCHHVIHFNNAGASLMPEPVLKAVLDYLHLEAKIGGYEAEERAQNAIEHVYDAIATLIGCERNEIAIVENATVAWDMAFYSTPFQKGDCILTSMSEYASNYLAFLQIVKQKGVAIEVIPNDEYGQVSVDALEKMINPKVKLIAITHIPTNGGLVNPAEKIGDIAKKEGILYLLDACQSVGQMPVNVKDLNCDMLSATGRKFLRGPRGTGFLYIKKDLIEQLEPPFIDLHAATWTAADQYKFRNDARRFENWESNYASKIGLGVAVDYALSWGLDPIWERVSELGRILRLELHLIPGVSVHDLGEIKCGIVSFLVEGKDPFEVKKELSKKNINVSVTDVESTRLDMESRLLTGLIRASVHYYNTKEEVGSVVDFLTP